MLLLFYEQVLFVWDIRVIMHWKSYKYVVWSLLASGFASCYPTGKREQAADNEVNEEKLFPNGTVIGRYSYVDKDGNPIQVKYYADEASYGVELKSLKIVDPSTPASTENSKEFKPVKVTAPDSYFPLSDMSVPEKFFPKSELPIGVLNSIDSIPKGKVSIPFQYLNKKNRYKNEKPDPDFEIYYQNELQGAEKCGKEKVHVYFDKERKLRNDLDHFERDKYYGRF